MLCCGWQYRNSEGFMLMFSLPGFLAFIFFCSHILALDGLDRLVLKIDLFESESVYFRIPLAINNCYQEGSHKSKQIITIYGEGLLQGLKNSEEYIINDVPGQNCLGHSFMSLDMSEQEPRVKFDLWHRDDVETKLKYEARLVYYDRDDKNIGLKLDNAEYARVAQIYRNKIKESLDAIRDNIIKKSQVEFSDIEIADFGCDGSFEIICSHDNAVHRAPRLSMTGYMSIL